MDLFNNLFIVFSCLLTIPALVFALQVFLALRVTEPLGQQAEHRPRVAVLVPAHNEEEVIANTLQSITLQLGENDQLLVVADNCTDNTATIARKYTTHVIERQDESLRGKGYALDFGLQFLEENIPPEIVIIIDADCSLSPACIDMLAQQADIEHRPVQALYLMEAPKNKSITQAIAEFAWLVKNHVRPLGLKHLGLPCQLMGTGMAFPWDILRRANLAHGNMVEDMKLGIDLATQGYPPLFCPEALVTSEFPTSQHITHEQRKRWEHGHLSTIFNETPGLLKATIQRRDISLLSMALDLSVPPLSLLGLCLIVMLSMTILLTFFTAYIMPLVVMASLSSIFAASVFIAWYRFGREIVAFKALCGVPLYILRKIPLYVAFLIKRQKDWVKTERR